MLEEETSFYDQIDTISDQDAKFKREAYFFIYSALDHTVRKLKRDREATAVTRHVTGHELCHGIAAYGRDQFGPMVKSVFEYWGISETVHFGEIVFSLVRNGLMSKTEEDRLADFENVYRFADLFDPKTIQDELRDLDLKIF
ncbi:MAG: Minf_1886 family protein [Candidatus Latescibacterota bacterium]|nr:Minf_1886 family protein [Candidatus Latescibacterota bacterium]